MTEFVHLDEREQDTPIIPINPRSISNITPDSTIIDGTIDKEEVDGICADYDVITIDKIGSVQIEEEGVEHVCVKEDCDVSRYYGCTNGNDGFQKENLFSELTDEYLRTIARINLGIAEEYALKWGNIKGNLSNQKDLYTFVTDSIAFDINQVIDEINLKLALWACEIETRLNNKADIYSPSFTGTPTTTLPLMTDNSSRIASTEWVNARIEASTINDNVKTISVSPSYMCYGDDPVDVKVVWEYGSAVEELSLNDIVLPSNIREYTFPKVTTSMLITLKYRYGGVDFVRTVTFDIKYPNYYGTSPDYTQLQKTIDNVFTVTAEVGDYIYIMIPNGSKANLGVSSIIGGFLQIGILLIFNNAYYVFKSINSGLGETTVELFNQVGANSDIVDTTTVRELLATKADKYEVYNKEEINLKFFELELGDINLTNYYTKDEVNKLIPDVLNKADKNEIPTKVSQLINDSNFINRIPDEYITEDKLNSKGFITSETEPLFSASAAKTINASDIDNWNNKVDKIAGMGLSELSFSIEEKAKLSGLTNYDDTNIRLSITNLQTEIQKKANKDDIPNIDDKANKTDIPTLVSQLTNDAGYITNVPDNLVTISELDSRGYLTLFTETDPTVPEWAKQPTKPTYSLEELGAEAAGSAAAAILEANQYTNQQIQILIAGADPSLNTFKTVSDAILLLNKSILSINTQISTILSTLDTKASKSDLLSIDYNNLLNLPEIPSIDGLASLEWVTNMFESLPDTYLTEYALKSELPDMDLYVEKVEGKSLSTNDFTNKLKQKLDGMSNYDDSLITEKINLLEANILSQIISIPLELYNSDNPSLYFDSFDNAKTYVESLFSSKVITLNISDTSITTCYFKSITTISEEGSQKTTLVLKFHYNDTTDLKLSFVLTEKEISSYYDFTKSFIPILINDLTTNNETASLSAALGKILMDKINLLEELISKINSNSYLISENNG